jgi:hypothetical protein
MRNVLQRIIKIQQSQKWKNFEILPMKLIPARSYWQRMLLLCISKEKS